MQVDPDSTAAGTPHWVAVAVPTPAHSNLAEPLTYRSDQPLAPGTLVRVPLGKREVLGVVWHSDLPAPAPELVPQVRPVAPLEGLAPGDPALIPATFLRRASAEDFPGDAFVKLAGDQVVRLPLHLTPQA